MKAVTIKNTSGKSAKSCVAKPGREIPRTDRFPAGPADRVDLVMQSGDAAGASVDRVEGEAHAELLQDNEVVILMLKPSPLYIVLGALTGLTVIAIITFLLAYVSRLPWIPWITWTDAQAFGFGTLLMVLRLCWGALDWYNRVYILTDRRVIRRMGVLRVAVFETPLSQIQHTSVFARVRERLFMLGTIGFATAGSDTYEAFWLMVSRPFIVHRIVVEAIQRYGRHR